jgi:hypothetical protein
MLHVTVKRHDRFQIELKVSYPLPSGARYRSHEFDLYFFAPRNLGVRRENYLKAQFYSDLQSYLRLTTPTKPLDHFAAGPDSPLARLRAVIEGAGIREASEPPSSYERAIKLFCSMLKSAVRDFSAYIRQTIDPDDREQLVATFVESLQEVCREYRALRSRIQLPGVAERTFEVYLFGDEWLSLLVEDRSYRLLEELRQAGQAEQASAALRRLVESEIDYRTRKGYPSVSDEHGDNELPVFRRSVLKKYMASILFLQTEVRKEGAFMRETLFGVAAALAMIFATAIAFATQSIYGALTPAVFIALVVSYIFKDRFKELLRTYFQQRLSDFLFDQKTSVRDAARRPVGKCRECFDFVDEHRLPVKVRELRASHHITELESRWQGEQILVYRKRVRLKAKAVHETFPEYDVPGVTDILRFNVTEFLRRMDDPTRELFVMDEDGYQRIKGARVYHLNLILHLRGSEKDELLRYRVVLTRKGIKRIEPVRSA